MMSRRRMMLPVVATLPVPPLGWHDVAYSVALTGKLAILRADFDVHACGMSRQDGDVTPIPEATRCRLSLFDGQSEGGTIEFPYEWAGKFDPLPNGDWAVADNWGIGYRRIDPSVRILSPRSDLLRIFRVGRDVECLQCDADGAIWVGYGDQAEWPFHGGIKFDVRGEILWRDSSVLYCDALNVTADRAWVYCEPCDFILDIDVNLRIRRRECPLVGASALAVDGDMALLAGGYKGLSGEDEDERDRLALLKVRDDSVEVIEEFRLDTVTDPDPEHPWLFAGRGDAFHIVRSGIWYRLSVAEAILATHAHP
jgi:hypothetical protein